MKQERLFDILGELNEELISEADPTTADGIRSKRTARKKPMRWALSAAAIVLVIAIWQISPMLQAQTMSAPASEENAMDIEKYDEKMREGTEAAQKRTGPQSEQMEYSIAQEELAVLEIPDSLQADGMGMGHIGYRSPSDFPSNDLYEAIRGTGSLPVYRYPAEHGEETTPAAIDVETLREEAEEFAIRMGVNSSGAEEEVLYRNLPNPDKGEKMKSDEEPDVSGFVLRGKGWNIQVDSILRTCITYECDDSTETSCMIPVKLVFEKMPIERELKETKEYLTEKYAETFGFANPQFFLYGGDTDFFGEQRYNIAMYEGGDPVQSFVNAALQYITFHSYEEPKSMISIEKTTLDSATFLGEYPILSEEEAKEKLISGAYLTTNGDVFPGTENLAQTNLVYRVSRDGTTIPYYEFTVEMPGEKHIDARGGKEMYEEGEETEEIQYFDNITVYSRFYVPAIRPEYYVLIPGFGMKGQ